MMRLRRVCFYSDTLLAISIMFLVGQNCFVETYRIKTDASQSHHRDLPLANQNQSRLQQNHILIYILLLRRYTHIYVELVY